VSGHRGIEGNEIVDQLVKKGSELACGIPKEQFSK
jgi:ribonuclease HI